MIMDLANSKRQDLKEKLRAQRENRKARREAKREAERMRYTLTEERRSFLIEYIAEKVSSRGMGTAAIMLLEVSRPFSIMTSTIAVGLTPLIRIFANDKHMNDIVLFLEDNKNISLLIDRIEELEEVREKTEKLARTRRRESRQAKKQARKNKETNNIKEKRDGAC